MKYFIIADIAGQYDALMRLIARAPKDSTIVAVGDLVDRGPDSNKVIEYFMANPQHLVVMGNHEHMMLDYLTERKFYGNGAWFGNGGLRTLGSYQDYPDMKVPESHIEWLKGLRWAVSVREPSGRELLITHAALDPKFEDAAQSVKEFSDDSVFWNRGEPIKRNFFQVFGHNSHWGLRWFSDADGEWAVCIDQSRKEILTAFQWPEKTIVTEPYKQTEHAKGAEL